MTLHQRPLGAIYMHIQKTHFDPSVHLSPVPEISPLVIPPPFIFCIAYGPFLLVPAGTIFKWWHPSVSKFIKLFPLWNGKGKFTHRGARG